jgi:hypothetical protein
LKCARCLLALCAKVKATGDFLTGKPRPKPVP